MDLRKYKCDVLEYDANDLIQKPNDWSSQNSKPTKFDELLQRSWRKVEDDGFLKYRLSSCQYKVIEASDPSNGIHYVAQLNPQRGFNRRKREPFESMNQSFQGEKFNFTKINCNEILFKLSPGTRTAVHAYHKQNNIEFDCDDNVAAVNVSPIDDSHILLIPQLSKCQPQRITVESLLLAFDINELSSRPGFRFGYNSIHAWASVNHLHYHAMYFNHKLFIDELDSTEHIAGNCYLVRRDFMLPGFQFHVPSEVNSRIETAKQIVKIVGHFHQREIPYNFTITRSTKALGSRAFLFPRVSTKGCQPSPCFDVACVEVAGHFPVKVEEEFESLTFDKVQGILKANAVASTVLKELVEAIKGLL